MRVKWWVIVLAVVLIVPIAIGVYVWQGMKDVNKMTINDVDVAQVADGTYTNRVDTIAIKVLVSVVVENAKITKIEILEHDNGQGSAAEAIVDDVIASQSLAVDSISGATLSSTVILKAVEGALLQTAN